MVWNRVGISGIPTDKVGKLQKEVLDTRVFFHSSTEPSLLILRLLIECYLETLVSCMFASFL